MSPTVELEELLSRIPEGAARRLVEIDVRAGARVDQQHRLGRGVERGAEALQVVRAALLLALGLLAHQELPDLAADHADRLQQARIRVAHVRAREAHHADGAAAGSDGKDERASVQCALRGTRCARVLAHVLHPERFTRLPDRSGQTLAAPIDQAAGARDVLVRPGQRLAPGLAEAQHAGVLIRGEVTPDRPALRLAHGAQHRLQSGGGSRGLRQA